MANFLCSPVLNQINAASGNPPVSRRHRDLVLAPTLNPSPPITRDIQDAALLPTAFRGKLVSMPAANCRVA
jgi:hypothetical protein